MLLSSNQFFGDETLYVVSMADSLGLPALGIAATTAEAGEEVEIHLFIYGSDKF